MIAKPKYKQILKLKTQADAFFPLNVVSAITSYAKGQCMGTTNLESQYGNHAQLKNTQTSRLKSPFG